MIIVMCILLHHFPWEGYMSKLSRQGALQVTELLGRAASLIEKNHSALGVPDKIAKDFAFRCDLLSDNIEKHAGIARDASGQILENTSILGDTGSLDPAVIGEEVDGPLLMLDSDEPWMDGEFTQQEYHELGDLQESGQLGPVHFASRLAKLEKSVQSLLKANR
jgi:hypothetical protein